MVPSLLEAILAMMLRSIRPVGNRIDSSAGGDPNLIEEVVEGYRVEYLNSGTAALARAISMACKRAGVDNPEVILPAYGCPDLVAAAVHAGALPVLADLHRESADYDAEAISALLNRSTVAIVAATFLGLRPDFCSLRAAIRDRSVLLVEDSAQWFPRTRSQRFCGDQVVLSFGRGKPVNVLGGGALLVRKDMEQPALPPSPTGSRNSLLDEGKVALYNLMIHPVAYGIAEKLPFLGIGRTRYHALNAISQMPEACRRRLPVNLRNYLSRALDVQNKWRSALEALSSSQVIDLPKRHGVPADCALLRYPILLSSKVHRDRAYGRLLRARLGASIMYSQVLPDIERIGSLVTARSDFSNARDFADRVLTLPTHEAVDDALIERALGCIAP